MKIIKTYVAALILQFFYNCLKGNNPSFFLLSFRNKVTVGLPLIKPL